MAGAFNYSRAREWGALARAADAVSALAIAVSAFRRARATAASSTDPVARLAEMTAHVVAGLTVTVPGVDD